MAKPRRWADRTDAEKHEQPRGWQTHIVLKKNTPRGEEYRFNKCKRCERVLKSRIKPCKTIRGTEWYWYCYMCLNMQRYPK